MTCFPLRSFALACAIGAASGASAAPNTLTAADPQGFVAALQGAGYNASYEPYDSGRPRIRSSINDTNYSIVFYSCDDAMADCEAILFVAGFDLSNGASFAAANDWNSTTIYSRVSLDEDMDPFLEMPIYDAREISRFDFEDMVDFWGDELSDFSDEVVNN